MPTIIPFANPHAAYLERRAAIDEAVRRVLQSGWYVLGAEVEAFEEAFTRWLGVSHFIGVASGTDAIEIALRGLGIGPGAAVFTVSHTAVATVSAIERAGAVPVLVDIDADTFTMSPDSLETAVMHVRENHPHLRPSAVIPVHLYGHPCRIDAILAIAERHDLVVVEDCAQGHGARFKGQMVGTFGAASAFSFYPTKNLGALGDAGGVGTSDRTLAAELGALRQYGWKERYISAIPGINSRLDPVQAAILSVQLGHLDSDNTRRRAIAATYGRELSGLGLTLPLAAPWAEHVYHLYVVRCPDQEAFVTYLRDHGIGAALHYPQAVHQQPAYTGRILLSPGGLPATEAVYKEIVSLPMFPQMTDSNVERVCHAVLGWTKAGR